MGPKIEEMIMKKLALLVALLALTSCTFIRDNFCTGSDAVKEITADALGVVPVVGPMAGDITDLAFEILCTLVGLPAKMGEELDSEVGVSLDPTGGNDGSAATDSGPGS